MKLLSAVLVAVILLPCAVGAQPATRYRLLRSISGSSDKLVGGNYSVEDVRRKFHAGTDKQIVIFFEWDGPVGQHKIEGLWKRPDGRTVELSEITLAPKESRFGAFWTYTLGANMVPGIWELEVRIDGEPGGAHAFEIVLDPGSAPPSSRNIPALDDLYKTISRSMVWIHKLDAQGERVSIGSGFVSGTGQVTTAFQNIDSASSVRVIFATADRRR